MLKKILVNSQDRQSGTPYDFKVKLPIRNTQKIHSLMVSKAMLANTWYNIQGKSIDLINPTTNQTQSYPIADGNYTITSLISVLNSILMSFQDSNSLPIFGPNPITFDYGTSRAYLWNPKREFTPKLSFDATTSTSIFKFLNFSGRIPIAIGAYLSTVPLASSGFVNMSPINYILIKSTALRYQETFEPETTNPNDFNSILATIPVKTNFGETIVYENTDTENMLKYSSHIPNLIDIKLCFYNNEPVYINTEWTMELLIRYE